MVRAVFVVMAVLAWCVEPAFSQVPTPGEVWAKVRSAYRDGPVAERTIIQITTPEGQVRRSSVLVRVDAKGKRLRLDLDRVLLFATEDRLVSAAARGGESVFVASLAPPLSPASLALHVPSTPFPQLALALGEERDALVPRLVERVAWREAKPGERGGLVLLGDSPAGAVKATIDAKTHRLRSMLAQTKAGRLEYTFFPKDAGGDWSIPTEGRAVVSSLAELKVGPKEPAPGERVAGLNLLDERLAPSALASAWSEEPAGAKGSAGFLIVLRVDALGRPASPAEGLAGLAAARAASAKVRAAGGRAIVRTVGVLAVAPSDPEKLADASRVWGGPGFVPKGKDDAMLWCAAAWTLVDRFVPSTNAAVLVVDEQQKFLGGVGLDGRAADAAEIEAELDAIAAEATKEAGAPGK